MIGIIGAGGHAKVVTDIFEHCCGGPLIFFANSSNKDSFYSSYAVYEFELEVIRRWLGAVTFWHVAIGHPQMRKEKTEDRKSVV